MSTDVSLPEIEILLAAKLHAAREDFLEKTIRRLDVGLFPWHGWIELSVLLADDCCDVDDIAAWPHYNFSSIQEGKWADAVDICQRMRIQWESGVEPNRFFKLFGAAMKSSRVRSALNEFNRSEGFCLTLFDPDSPKSGNYCS
jgi:hypothetical protein